MDQVPHKTGSSREAPAASSVIDPSLANRPDLLQRFDRDNDRLFVRRLAFTLFLFLSFVAVIGVVEWVVRPSNGERLLRDFASLVGVSAIGLALCSPVSLHGAAKWLALPLISYFLGRLSADAMLLGSQAQHLAMWHVCILTGTAVLLPWGGSLQSCAAIGALASFSWALSSLVAPDGVIFPVLGLVTGATISIFGARFLHEYRRSTFLQTAMLQEEADVAAALGHVGEVLSVNLNRPDMLEKVNQLAVELIGCDWSGTFTWHDRPRGYPA